MYSQNLNEEQKEELKNILSMSDADLNNSVSELKETVLSKVNNILSEETETELTSKLNNVISEVNLMETTKYNYYRLKQLKDGLD